MYVVVDHCPHDQRVPCKVSAHTVFTNTIASRYADGDNQGLEYFEVVCNPNAYATAFDAKVLITMRSSQGLKVTTEGRLSNLKGDVDTFLDT